MTPAEIVAALEQQFGGKIKSKKLDALDPFVVVDAADLVEVCRFLKNDSRMQFDMLNCVSGVDYLEPDPKKAPKAGFAPHLEVIYHFQSFAFRHRIAVKVHLPRWKAPRLRTSCRLPLQSRPPSPPRPLPWPR